VVRAGGAVLRYGGFYGPGATDEQVELVRKRLLPLVAGGNGYVSWIHVDDAASATVLAVEQKAHGVFNIADDEPAPASEWLPYLAECVGAKPPRRVPAWLAIARPDECGFGLVEPELARPPVSTVPVADVGQRSAREPVSTVGNHDLRHIRNRRGYSRTGCHAGPCVQPPELRDFVLIVDVHSTIVDSLVGAPIAIPRRRSSTLLGSRCGWPVARKVWSVDDDASPPPRRRSRFGRDAQGQAGSEAALGHRSRPGRSPRAPTTAGRCVRSSRRPRVPCGG
jgi:hypothetical protein